MKKINYLVAILAVSLLGIQSASAAIVSQLDFGSRGEDVTELQTYLASNASIYPEGLVTGYFGALTQAAVQRFQTAQGMVSSGTPATTGYGRVGPLTMARINSLLGGGTQVSWDAVPWMGVASVAIGNSSATISWSTNEPTQGQVYFDKAPLRVDEQTGPMQIPFVSGTLATTNSTLLVSHAVVLQNLTPNTQYYFLTRGIDSAGNLSLTWPSTFRTNP